MLRRWLIGLLIALAFAAAYYVLAIQRVHGDVLNSYPVVLMDGVDWLFEGHAVAARLAGNSRIVLPLLRNPVYVLCVAADAALGGSGRLLFALHAAAFFVQVVLLMAVCELLGTDRRLQLALPLLLGLSALGAYRFAIFPDDLAVAQMLAAVLALLLWRRTRRPSWLAVAGLTTVTGALTQEYAAIPLAAATLFDSVRALRRRQLPPWRLLATCVFAGLLYAAANHAWKDAVPHAYERNLWAPFSNPDNSFPFILGTNLALWLHSYWPLAGVLAAGVARLRGAAEGADDPALPRLRPSPREAAGLAATVAGAFAVLLLAYRWPDARYTYIFTPVVLLLCCSLSRSATAPSWPASLRWLASPLLATVLWVAQGLGVARPFDPWVGPAARQSIPAVLRFPAADRYSLRSRCGSMRDFCAAAGQPQPMAAYDRVILCEYRSLRVEGTTGRCGGLETVTNVVPVRQAAPSATTGCAADATHLCLAAGRFRAAVTWRAGGRSGNGHAATLSAGAGYFWFFAPAEPDLVVKIVDGRPVNGRFWVFRGALSDVEYTLTVGDTASGRQRSYSNPPGRLTSAADTGAF
jgi:hypothetical protein